MYSIPVDLCIDTYGTTNFFKVHINVAIEIYPVPINKLYNMTYLVLYLLLPHLSLIQTRQ